MSRIYEIFGTDAHAMAKALMERVQVAGLIPAGASVALKPNLVVAAHPDSGATTHAGVLSGAIEYLQDHGMRDISILESSWVGDRTERAFVQPILTRREDPLWDQTPLGAADRRRWLYIGGGGAAVRAGDRLRCQGADFLVREAAPVYLEDGAPLYWWATLVREREAAT